MTACNENGPENTWNIRHVASNLYFTLYTTATVPTFTGSCDEHLIVKTLPQVYRKSLFAEVMLRNVSTRRGRLRKVSEGPKEVLNRMRMSTWEKGQPIINKIYEDVGGWMGEVTWQDLKVDRYPVKILYMRCPRKVFSYYEHEIRRLRAERKSAEKVSPHRTLESTLETSMPQPSTVGVKTTRKSQERRVPEAIMYGRRDERRTPALMLSEKPRRHVSEYTRT